MEENQQKDFDYYYKKTMSKKYGESIHRMIFGVMSLLWPYVDGYIDFHLATFSSEMNGIQSFQDRKELAEYCWGLKAKLGGEKAFFDSAIRFIEEISQEKKHERIAYFLFTAGRDDHSTHTLQDLNTAIDQHRKRGRDKFYLMTENYRTSSHYNQLTKHAKCVVIESCPQINHILTEECKDAQVICVLIDISASMKEMMFDARLVRCKQKMKCTYSITGRKGLMHDMYKCWSCFPNENHSICYACAFRCHKDHKVEHSGYSTFFCDCGAKGHFDRAIGESMQLIDTPDRSCCKNGCCADSACNIL